MKFDLRTEKWIPCIDYSGKLIYMGLHDVLSQAHDLREVRDDSPCVTAALLRLMLAILYDCFLWARETGDLEWEQMWGEGKFPTEVLAQYFAAHSDCFDLLSAKRPFLQLATMKPLPPSKKELGDIGDSGADAVPGSTINKLAVELASNNNATLFDHSFNDETEAISPAQAARWLLAAQNFALPGGNSARYNVNNRTFPPLKFKFQAAPAVTGAMMWLSGEWLFETLMLNLMPGRFDRDEAVWNLSPIIFSERVTDFSGPLLKVNGPMEQFVFPCRAIHLVAEEDLTVKGIFFTQGRRTDKSFPDPMKTYFVRKEGQQRVALSLDRNRALWRDAHALFKLQPRIENPKQGRGITALYNAARECVKSPVSLHVVGLVIESSARIVLWRHERLFVPHRLLQDKNRVAQLGNLLREVEGIGQELRERVIHLCEILYAPDYGRKDSNQKKPKKKNLSALIQRFDTTDAYYATLGQQFDTLLSRLGAEDDIEVISDWWCHEVETIARHSLEESIDRLGSTRRDLLARRSLAEMPISFVTERTKKLRKQQQEKAKKSSRKKGEKEIP